MFCELENIVFDFGGVLIDLNRDRYIDSFRRIGYPQADEMISLYGPSGGFRMVETGEWSKEQLVEYIRQDSGHPEITLEQVRDAYVDFLGTIPVKKLRGIEALRRAGYRTYGLSNINDFVMPHVRERLFTADGRSINDYFDYTYLSFEMGLVKPDAAIFEQMIAHSGMNPERTLFIDDSAKNIAAARELGFQVYLAAPEEDFSPLIEMIIASKQRL